MDNSGGGNAHQRAVLKTAVKRAVSEEFARLGLQRPARDPEVNKKEQDREPSIPIRLIKFIEQPLFLAAFGIIGGIVGLIFTPFLIVVGLCIIGAFHRAEVVKGRSWRVQFLIYLPVFIGTTALVYSLNKEIKKAIRIPTASQIAAAVVELLPHQAISETTNVYQTVQQSQASNIPVPNFRVEPEGEIGPVKQPNQQETFMLEAHNLSGADIDHVRFDKDFFVAEVGIGKPTSSVRFRRYGSQSDNLLTAPFINANDITLPQNNKVLFPVMGAGNVAPGQSADDNMLLILMKQEPGVRKLAGVRIEFTYERYLDHKPFTYVTVYQFRSSDGYRTILGLSSGTKNYPSQARSELLDISDIRPYASDKTKWEDVTFGISFANGKVTRRFDADKEQ